MGCRRVQFGARDRAKGHLERLVPFYIKVTVAETIDLERESQTSENNFAIKLVRVLALWKQEVPREESE